MTSTAFVQVAIIQACDLPQLHGNFRLSSRLRSTLFAIIFAISSGCGWTGKPPVMSSLPETVPPVLKTKDDQPEESSSKRKLLLGASPVVKPRQSLDEMFLFQPVKIAQQNPPPAPSRFEDVDFAAADGTKLHGWWLPNSQPHAVVLYLHGNGGNLWYLTNQLRWLNETTQCSVFAVDYRGYGLSEGTPTVAGVLKDVRAARIETAKRAGIAATEVVLMGRSLGGALAIQSASEVPPRALIVESTFTTLEEVGKVHMGALAKLVPNDRLESLSALAECSAPLLHSHGDADRVIPFEQGEQLHQVAAGPKQFIRIPGGDHNDPPTRDYLAALERFLAELPSTSGP